MITNIGEIPEPIEQPVHEAAASESAEGSSQKEEPFVIKYVKYRHYKGKEYAVLSIAKNSETLEDMVVYKQLYDNGDIWVRPAKMFAGFVDKDGRKVRRFEYIDTEW